jgi:hypothetical protein
LKKSKKETKAGTPKVGGVGGNASPALGSGASKASSPNLIGSKPGSPNAVAFPKIKIKVGGGSGSPDLPQRDKQERKRKADEDAAADTKKVRIIQNFTFTYKY